MISPESPSHAIAQRHRGRGLTWGLGGTILSVIGFIALALFEQYNSMVGELRSNLKHFNETSSEFVKKENVQRYRDEMRECLKEIHVSNAARSRLEQELRASENTREEMVKEVQRMRERLAFVEGRQTAVPTNVSTSAVDK
ncbi:MAG: hypothetical protein ACJ8FY_03125 [Gemmataceae bacterium]